MHEQIWHALLFHHCTVHNFWIFYKHHSKRFETPGSTNPSLQWRVVLQWTKMVNRLSILLYASRKLSSTADRCCECFWTEEKRESCSQELKSQNWQAWMKCHHCHKNLHGVSAVASLHMRWLFNQRNKRTCILVVHPHVATQHMVVRAPPFHKWKLRTTPRRA